MQDKKKYLPPQIYEVPLKQEQAILAACSTSWATAKVNKTKCSSGSCKKHRSGNSASPAS
ncbi:MAG: hypothetical protein AUJ72_00850 [Candidatus Omnitrophica bacterium CG1_02_46_14]|nr:MAG: hypothetical protein AUJ72_00850 [Candidatus Omnitrophica bacterium CG1_02_46_14]